MCFLNGFVSKRRYDISVIPEDPVNGPTYVLLRISEDIQSTICMEISSFQQRNVDGLVQDCSNASALPVESLQACIKAFNVIWCFI